MSSTSDRKSAASPVSLLLGDHHLRLLSLLLLRAAREGLRQWLATRHPQFLRE